MTEENESALLALGPTIFREHAPWGLSVGDGWVPLLRDLIIKLEARASKTTIPLVVVQVKEKFGGLRFYTHNGDGFDQDDIRAAEGLSFKTCEWCGTKGGPDTTNTGWMLTLCPPCIERRAKGERA